MSKETKYCLWCGSPFVAAYSKAHLCSARCRMAMMRYRKANHPYSSPLEFKEFILSNLASEYPYHPNPQHPVAILDKNIAEVYNAATEVVNAVGNALRAKVKKDE